MVDRRKEKERKGPPTRPLLLLKHPLMPSNYEPPSGIIHPWLQSPPDPLIFHKAPGLHTALRIKLPTCEIWRHLQQAALLAITSLGPSTLPSTEGAGSTGTEQYSTLHIGYEREEFVVR